MSNEYKRHQCFPLRLSPSLRGQAVELAKHEGVSLNHFICLAVTEKVTRMEETSLHALQRQQGNENSNLEMPFRLQVRDGH